MYIRKAASPTPCESLWEALGLGEKVLKKPFHIAEMCIRDSYYEIY